MLLFHLLFCNSQFRVSLNKYLPSSLTVVSLFTAIGGTKPFTGRISVGEWKYKIQIVVSPAVGKFPQSYLRNR